MNNILISDVSLKTACEGLVNISFKEKLEIVNNLSELNVDCIEFSLPKNKADEVLLKTVSACQKHCVISCEAGYSIDSVEKAFSYIKLAKKNRIIVSIPISPLQMEYKLGKKPALVLDLLKTLATRACEICNDVEVSFEDATRAETDFLEKAIKVAIDCGVKSITINDVVGNLLPDEFSLFLKKIYDELPELNSILLNVSCSDSFSMAVASSISAINVGVRGIKVSSLKNINYPLTDRLISALDFIVAKKGFGFNINKTAIKRVISRITNYDSSVVAEKTNEENIEIEKSLSEEELSNIIKNRGYDLTDEDLQKVINEFRRLSEKKNVSLKELEVIIATTSLQVNETYSLKNFSVNTSNVISSTACISLIKDSLEYKGISFGNGPVDASFLAIENITKRHFELDDFELSAVTEGKEAMGQAIIKLRNNGILYSGKGVSTDIIGAAIRAYLNALNKIVYDEKI